MRLDPIVSLAPTSTGASSAPASPGSGARTTPPNTVISTIDTPISPPGYTKTVTTQADGAVTAVITNPSGAAVATTLSSATMPEPAVLGSSVNIWA